MKFIKIAAFSLTIFAICFTGAVFYILSNASNAAYPNLSTANDVNVLNVKDKMEDRLAKFEANLMKEGSNTKPEQSVSIQHEQAVPPAAQSPKTEQQAMDEQYEELHVASTSASPSDLIIGRWQSANNPNGFFEFFQDGTFTRGNYKSKNNFNEFSGTYSFSSGSRLKLQYEKWSVGTESGYRNTRSDDTSHVFEISIDDNKLIIPEAEELFGTMEWTRVD